ncbi:MAG: hypothetical protein ISR65_13290 [Bacteriovoracaceae bacterium]|nr:hypothetical protein [Bacteriovoracaceae bacterium]
MEEIKKQLKHQSQNLSIPKLLFTDFISMFFSLGPGLVAWAMAIYYAKLCFVHIYSETSFFPFLLALIGVPLVLVVNFVVAVAIFRLFIPKMKPGIYKIGISKGFAAWYLTLCLGHSVRMFGLQPFFFTFYITKFLYWRAMGAKVAYGFNSSLFLTLADYPLITIDKGCSFGAYVHIACHSFLGDKLFLAPVHIGEDVYVGMNVIIGPKTKIGKGSWIGMNNVFMQDSVPEYTKIDHCEWEYGNPEKQDMRLKNKKK